MDADSIWDATIAALNERSDKERNAWLAYHGFHPDGTQVEPQTLAQIAEAQGLTSKATIRLRVLAADAHVHKHISRNALAENCRLRKLIDSDTPTLMQGEHTRLDSEHIGNEQRTTTSYAERRMWGWELELDREARDTTARQRGVGERINPQHDAWMRGRTLEAFHQSMLNGRHTS